MKSGRIIRKLHVSLRFGQISRILQYFTFKGRHELVTKNCFLFSSIYIDCKRLCSLTFRYCIYVGKQQKAVHGLCAGLSWSCTHVFITWTVRHTCAPHFRGIISVWPGTYNMRYFTEITFRERSQHNAFPTTTGRRQMARDMCRSFMCRNLTFKYVFMNGEVFLLQMR